MLWLSTLLSALTLAPAVLGFTDYANDFPDPTYVLSKDFNTSTTGAQATIVAWADDLAAQGPWSVMNKSVVPPTGNKHDYMSWGPYWWPNCTDVGNTTALTPEQIWVTCPYYQLDGQFNPDGRLVNDTGNFDAMANAVLYNALAWVITGTQQYSANAANFLNVWFLDADTSMNPNLDYAQMHRGPTGQVGTHTGVLDLKGMAIISSAILILREGNSTDWTSTLDGQMNTWLTQYITWLQTNPLALAEGAATNNHGTFYYNQLAAIQIVAGDKTGALNTTTTYFNAQYMNQINANGEQPLEAARTRPYHYRCYNLAGMITNARIGEYLGTSFWNKTTTQGATIQTALDYTMTVPPGADAPAELYPNLAAVAATYGDPTGKYATWLAQADDTYPQEPYFFWDQPFSDSNLAAATPSATASAVVASASTSATAKNANGAASSGPGYLGVFAGVVVAFLSF
ncbi:hypothetical protein HWV62_18852 [Athelia sp. TMB]|nr:hypothetical protein HWV62_18852 [Athelia sp. TMB]